MSWTLFTDLYKQVLLCSLVDTHCHCCDSVCVQLVFNSTWSFIMASRARQATIWSSSLLFITDLNTAWLIERSLTAAISCISSTSVMLECWQNLSKLTNQRVYQILVYRNDLLMVKFSHRCSLTSSRRASLYFFARCFLRCALLTERLEEVSEISESADPDVHSVNSEPNSEQGVLHPLLLTIRCSLYFYAIAYLVLFRCQGWLDPPSYNIPVLTSYQFSEIATLGRKYWVELADAI